MDPQTVPVQSDIAQTKGQMEPHTESQKQIFDTIVIGGGPAGVAAAVYTGRKKLKTLIITDSFGGQSIVSDDIQNWIGEPHISGLDLAKKLESHVRSFQGIVDIKSPEKAVKVNTLDCEDPRRFCDFEVVTDKDSYRGRSVILCAGARRRKLGIPGEDKFEGKGVSYCSTCDGPLFKDKKVAVVGGGNAGLEAVQDLFPYASEIYLLEYGEVLKGDPATAEEIRKNLKLKEIILNAQTVEVIGDSFVAGLKYKDRNTNEEKALEVGGIFVEVGSVPNSEVVKNLVQLDPYGQVMVNSKHSTTSHPGIFAAGDITDDPYKQSNIAVGDAIRAALAVYSYLLNRTKQSPATESPSSLPL